MSLLGKLWDVRINDVVTFGPPYFLTGFVILKNEFGIDVSSEPDWGRRYEKIYKTTRMCWGRSLRQWRCGRPNTVLNGPPAEGLSLEGAANKCFKVDTEHMKVYPLDEVNQLEPETFVYLAGKVSPVAGFVMQPVEGNAITIGTRPPIAENAGSHISQKTYDLGFFDSLCFPPNPVDTYMKQNTFLNRFKRMASKPFS